MSTRWTDADSANLDRQIRALREMERRERAPWVYRDTRPKYEKPPSARLAASGKWVAKSGRLGHGQRTFDTEAEAQAWLDQLQKEQ